MSDWSNAIVPPTARTLTDQVVRQLRSQIILGHLAPGERLVEQRLTQHLQVSRSTVREALRRLEAMGLVETKSHHGSSVAELNPDDAFQICEMHVLLEGHALRQLRLPIDDTLRQHLQAITEQMATLQFPEEIDRFLELDNAFHYAIVSATGQYRILQVWNTLGSLLGVLVALVVRYIPVDGPTVAQRHRTLLEALSGNDLDAASEALATHYHSLDHQIREALVMNHAHHPSGGDRLVDA